MELNRFKSGYYFLILIPVGVLFLLGSWWLFLVFKLASRLNELNHPLMEGNLIKMVKWEGASFIALLFFLTVALFWIYFQDFKKNQAMQAFFASLTHELKSPLASINLQAQVLREVIASMELSDSDRKKLSRYMERLDIESTRLEDQLDNHLQLSRIERDAPLNMREIPLKSFVQQQVERYRKQIDFDIDISSDLLISGDDYGVQIVFRNLIENTLKHRKSTSSAATIIAKTKTDKIEVIYNDHGSEYTGDKKRLGQLFFKHNSPQGTGIGIYLVKKLMNKMNGDLEINSTENLIFKLTFLSKASSDK